MQNSRLAAWGALLLAALIASANDPCPAIAYAPAYTSIQGILTDASGTPLPDGTYNVTLRLYDQDVGGNLLFTEYKPIVTEDGLFTTELGAAAYANDLVFANASNWLEVQVDGYPAMSPRIRLTSAPYARSTSQWHTIPGGVSSLGTVGIGVASPQAPLHVLGDGELARLQGNNGATSMAYLSFWENSGMFTGWIGDGSPTDLDMYLVSNAGDVNLNTVAGSVLTATAGGNVGIRTTTPQAPLHVAGDGYAVRLQKSGIGAASTAYVTFTDAESTILGRVGNAGLDMYLASDVGDVRLYTPAGIVLTASAAGNVGIGTTTPTEKLQVGGITNGSIALTGNLSGYPNNTWPTLKSGGQTINFDAAGVWTGYIAYNSGFMDVSDKSMKDDIRRIDGALEKVSQINGVKFKWADNRDQGQDHIGVIAQDVEKVAPELVGQPEGMSVKAVNYGGLNALTIEAIKELKARVEQLEAELAEMKAGAGAAKGEGE